MDFTDLASAGMKHLGDTAKGMFSSWLKKPQEESTASWLGREVGTRIGIDEKAGAAIGDEIMKHIHSFNRNLQDLNTACAQGQTKEQWLRQKLSELPPEQEAEALLTLQQSLGKGNQAVWEAVQSKDGTVNLNADEIEMQETSPENWNRLARQQALQNVVKQVNFANAGAMTLAAKLPEMAQDEESLNADVDLVNEEAGSDADIGIKATAAGALKVAAHKKWIPFLTKKTPLSIITNIANWGVEAVRTAGRVFSGKSTVAQGVEHMGRVTSAAVADVVTDGVATKLVGMIPAAGPVLGATVGVKIAEQTKKPVRDAIYQGFQKIKPVVTKIAETAVKAVNTVKNAGKKILSSLFG